MKIAVIIPCLNEQAAIARVVADCLRHLPHAKVYVLDNGSEDQTAFFAAGAGATVIHSPLRGKGSVIRHAFRVIDADFFLLVDGDGTYPLSEAQRLLELAQHCNYEMVMGSRLQLGRAEAFRPLHYFGNVFFTRLVRILFNYPVQDLLTGYRVFSKRFTREVNLISNGFEIETELTIRAMAQNLSFCEVAIPYTERIHGSRSKLRTFRDGWRILMTIIQFLMYFRPIVFFSVLSGVFLAGSELHVMPAWPWNTASALFFVMGFYLHWQLHVHRLEARSEPPAFHQSSDKKEDRSNRNRVA